MGPYFGKFGRTPPPPRGEPFGAFLAGVAALSLGTCALAIFAAGFAGESIGPPSLRGRLYERLGDGVIAPYHPAHPHGVLVLCRPPDELVVVILAATASAVAGLVAARKAGRPAPTAEAGAMVGFVACLLAAALMCLTTA